MDNQIRVVSVNASKLKGTVKRQVNQIVLSSSDYVGDSDHGIYNQVSLLGKECYDRFQLATGQSIPFGELGEDITVTGFDTTRILPLDRLVGQDVELEFIGAGMKCPPLQTGDSLEGTKLDVISKEHTFARVLKSGIVFPGYVFQYIPKVFRIFVLTLSDRAFHGAYTDRSGPLVVELINNHFSQHPRKINIETGLLADDKQQLIQLINRELDKSTDIIFTTGGTGVGMRDITVDAIKPMLTKEIPGIMEMIRIKYGSNKPNALLSRSVAGFINNSLVYTLPGSVKAVNEYMEEILKTLEHLIYMRHGLDIHEQ